MNFARRALLAGCIVLFFAAVAPRMGHGPRTVPPLYAQSALPGPSQSSSKSPAPPHAYSLPPAKLAKAIALSRIRYTLDIAGSLWGLAVLWLLLATRGAARLEAWAGRVSRQLRWPVRPDSERLPHRRWIQGLLFFAIFLVILTVANLPLDIYAHHVSRAFGIRVSGWGLWLGDMAKSLGLSLLIGTPVLLLFNWIVRRWPRRYWLACWIVAVPLIVLSVFIEPLAEPIFNEYEPLAKQHPALVAELEKVVARTGTNIPPERMYLMKASEKTNGLNAYVTGIGATKRIVVWDTTAGRIPDDEILFVFAHESGHYVLNHIPKGLAVTAVALFFVFWACARFAAWLARRFGPRWGIESLSTRTGFVLLLFVASVASFLLDPLSNAVSRHFEHQADVYGQEAIHGLVPDPQQTAVASFNALGAAWLDDPSPSPIIEFWLYSHPSTQTRANFALHYDPWVNGGHGEFFDK
jgi:STE24 endopeptidase